MAKILNVYGTGVLSKFLFSGQAPSTNSYPSFFSSSNSCDQSFDSLFANINPCTYCDDPDSVSNQIPSSNELLFVHVNIRSLNKNFDDLSHCLSQFSVPPNVVTETRLKDSSLVSISISGDEFVFANS